MKEKRTTALVLGMAGCAQFCLDWALLVQAGLYYMLPIAVIDGGLAVANLVFYLTG